MIKIGPKIRIGSKIIEYRSLDTNSCRFNRKTLLLIIWEQISFFMSTFTELHLRFNFKDRQ